MCTTCGCGSGQTKIEGEHEHTHVHADGTVHSHPHGHGHGDHGHEHAHPHHGAGHGHEHGHVHADGTMHSHPHDYAHDADRDRPHGEVHSLEHVHADGTRHAHPHHHAHGAGHEHAHGPDHAHAPGLTPAQMVRIERDILGANDEIAARNRRHLEDAGMFALNLVSSPGAGKTTLLVETIRVLAAELPLAVIEGDQQTTFDADRIRATGARAIQVNTGKGCHLDAAQVERALAQLAPADESVLFIENVGNLVCPSAFDLGEAHKVVVLSVTEGEDKPLKYPDMFAASDLLLLNKIDLLPHVRFDVKRAIEYARRVRPGIEVLQVSATGGDGMAAWLDWVRAGAKRARERRQQTIATLRQRIAELEARVGRR
jgi:hydrogenase nickel incorporation protein HypB